MFIPILTLLHVVYQSCSSETPTTTSYSWLNTAYVKCLEKKLPCHCQETIGSYYSLVLDRDETSKNFGVSLSKFDQMEPYTYPIKKLNDNEYGIYESVTDTLNWAKIDIDAGELNFAGRSTSSTFVASTGTRSYDPTHYLLDNVVLLNDALTTRRYPTLETILNEDYLNCDCNKWMDGVNVVSVRGKPKSWIITLRGEYLVIDKITNIDRDLMILRKPRRL